MIRELPADKEALSAFYDQVAAEFEKIADHLLDKGIDDFEWLHDLRFKAIEIRAGADSVATWLATLHSQMSQQNNAAFATPTDLNQSISVRIRAQDFMSSSNTTRGL